MIFTWTSETDGKFYFLKKFFQKDFLCPLKEICPQFLMKLCNSSCQMKKKMYILKVENSALLDRLVEDSSPGHSISDALRGHSQEVRGEPGSTGVFGTKTR